MKTILAGFFAVALWAQYIPPGGGGGGTGCVPGGSSGQVLVGDGAGGCTALSTSGTGNGIRQTSPTIVTPTIASFTNATHDHSNAAGGGTLSLYGLVGSPLSQFAATTSAQLAATISDETGSGPAVFATSPTLTTPNIGAATGTSLTVTGAISSGSGSGIGGALDLLQGTLPSIITNTISLVAPTSVTGYEIVMPGAAATGIRHLTNASNVVTESVGLIVNADITNSTIDLTAKVTGVLPNANTTAASANTASAIVTRDGSGNFTAGTITASLTGHSSLDLALTGGTMTGQFINSLNGAASTPPWTLTGSWFSGGSATTTKPQALIECSGAATTGWSTAGTGIGVNACTGFTGRGIDYQVNGVTQFNVTGANGNVASNGTLIIGAATVTSLTSNTTIGSTGAITSGSAVEAAGGSAFQWTGKSAITTASDGVIRLSTAAGTGMTRLQFGVTGATGPALTTTIQTNPIIKVQDATGGDTANLWIGAQKSTTGQRYACIDTNGQIVSSVAACVGT